jgi:hypothetical protein
MAGDLEFVRLAGRNYTTGNRRNWHDAGDGWHASGRGALQGMSAGVFVVEQAFMPAVKLVKQSASAIEVKEVFKVACKASHDETGIRARVYSGH